MALAIPSKVHHSLFTKIQEKYLKFLHFFQETRLHLLS